MDSATSPEYSIDDFEAGHVDPERFDHEAHVYVAWLYVREYPLSEALEKFDVALQRLVIKLGAEGKYHATLTWFFLLLIAQRAATAETWQVFKRSNTDLINDGKELLSRYYSDACLSSDLARQRFLLPDNLGIKETL